MFNRKLLSYFLSLFISCNLWAESTPVDRPSTAKFVSLKFQEVNVRVGPGKRYPVLWTFVSKGEPVLLIAEFEHWRKIQDVEGDQGWVHSNTLSRARSVITKSALLLHRSPNANSQVLAKIAPDVACKLEKIKNGYCHVKCNGISGWLPKEHLWGILETE